MGLANKLIISNSLMNCIILIISFSVMQICASFCGIYGANKASRKVNLLRTFMSGNLHLYVFMSQLSFMFAVVIIVFTSTTNLLSQDDGKMMEKGCRRNIVLCWFIFFFF